MYLPPLEIDRLFCALRAFRARSMRVIFSFMTRWPDGSTGFRPRSALVEWWLAWRKEPFTWALEPASAAAFLAVHRFSAFHDLAMFGDVSEGRHQALGILAREAGQHEEPRLPAVVRVSFVEKIVENLGTVDYGKVSVAELHIACIVTCRVRVPEGETNLSFEASQR